MYFLRYKKFSILLNIDHNEIGLGIMPKSLPRYAVLPGSVCIVMRFLHIEYVLGNSGNNKEN